VLLWHNLCTYSDPSSAIKHLPQVGVTHTGAGIRPPARYMYLQLPAS